MLSLYSLSFPKVFLSLIFTVLPFFLLFFPYFCISIPALTLFSPHTLISSYKFLSLNSIILISLFSLSFISYPFLFLYFTLLFFTTYPPLPFLSPLSPRSYKFPSFISIPFSSSILSPFSMPTFPSRPSLFSHTRPHPFLSPYSLFLL